MASFNVVQTYENLLKSDADLTMPVAAISALIQGLASTPTSTVSETLALVNTLTTDLKTGVPNNIALTAGTDLFKQYLVTNLRASTSSTGLNSAHTPSSPIIPSQQLPPSSRTTLTTSTPTSASDFDLIRDHLVHNGEVFVTRAKSARAQIAVRGRAFIRDGDTILTNGGSRVVAALLRHVAETAGRALRFRVIYVVDETATTTTTEGQSHIAALRELDVPVATIPASAVAHCLSEVTKCVVGAEGVVENGGVVSRLGTYQMALLAKALSKPFYVLAETHKFVRMYPLGQFDLGVEQEVLEFKIAGGGEREDAGGEDEGVADMEDGSEKNVVGKRLPIGEAVDYTPPALISAIITENGVKLPSAVSEELIKIWN